MDLALWISTMSLLALQSFKSDGYSLLVTDIAMPIMNGSNYTRTSKR